MGIECSLLKDAVYDCHEKDHWKDENDDLNSTGTALLGLYHYVMS
jgi:hypothetical protein